MLIDRKTNFSGLHDVLRDVLSAEPSEAATNRLFKRCHRLSVAYLRRRARAGRLNSAVFGLTLEDLALDCIADLFKREDGTSFERLDQYFGGLDWCSFDEAALEMSLRRLVFSVINEGLFRRYQEWDPTLGRIIRNLKRHLRTSSVLEMEREQFSLVVQIPQVDRLAETLPTMPPEVLEAQIHFAFEGRASVPNLVEVLPDILGCNGLYAPKVGLTDLALAYRSVIERLHEDDEQMGSADKAFERADLAEAVRVRLTESIEEVQEDMRDVYIDHRGISPSLYAAYFSTIRDVLTWQYVERATEKRSLRVALCQYIGHISSPSYRKQHQAVLEYLAKLTQHRLFQRAVHLV